MAKTTGTMVLICGSERRARPRHTVSRLLLCVGLLGLCGMAYQHRERIGSALDPYPEMGRATPAITYVRVPKLADNQAR